MALQTNLIHAEVLHLNAIQTQAIVYNQDPAVIKTKSNDSVRTMAGSWIDFRFIFATITEELFPVQ